ncbi:peptide/nickel transport system substrate-binding protein [Streptosporangium becharense]|uniref:Peptide/nickel transport system substrate-binding protein n=1 Tax=Streptosporangium becharense TaxID=1816182 RepID=A0A7W9ICR1_9ACTN|nr:ABC transporter substrate-binding protein [Streptosporangium becharense]MBB2913770.1 peptide/nickel transport system substrate-binding protein [Streptosporangium becharense]MBB5817851.1 peptide/nickel transport system substrate-binding protein [Streptosporangium becharense]
MSKSRKLAAVAVGAFLSVAVAACGGSAGTKPAGGNSAAPGGVEAAGYNKILDSVVNPSDKKGGTLNLWASQDADFWDPARGYYAFFWNMSRYFTRNLVTYDTKPGPDGLKLVPDAAAELPEISEDKLTYTFKLRDGLTFEDGTPVTSKDFKYGIERVFAQDVLPGGPVYLKDQLDQGQNYPGPYKDKDKDKLGLKSVETPDDKTIIFKLKKPFADFMYLLAMPGATPVPQAKDTGAKYTLRPFSSGPYKFESYEPGKKLVLVRNDQWKQESDPIRKALPDKVELNITTNADDLDARLLAGTADLDVGQSGVQQAARAKILQDPKLKGNADLPTTGFLRYVAIAQKVPPFDNIDCRKAVIYAADPTAMLNARGGPYAGSIGGNMLPSTVLGSDESYDPYGRLQGKPQPDKAKEALKACGKPEGFETKIAVRNNRPAEVKAAEALQQSLAAVGIKATLDQYDGKLSSSVVGSPDNVHSKGYGLIVHAWGPDWPGGYGYLQPLVDGRVILPNGNNNYSEVNDPQINEAFDKGSAETDPVKAAEYYKQANQRVMDLALYVPYALDKALNYRNPRLTNVYFASAWGMVDFQALGVSDGK